MNGGLPSPTVSAGPAAYPQLRRALSVHLRTVGDLVELGLEDAARQALSHALAIRAELDLGAS